LLRRYERARKEDALSLRVVTDGLQKLFATENSWIARARNFGLRTLQGQRQIKKILIHHAVI
jgi:2-polyprenyl-6-methoxyphenol hydroxylase-like FAD-dependent oxidoreductase